MSANTPSKIGNSARSAGTGIPDCAISASQADGLQRNRLAAGVGPADDELAMLRCPVSTVSGTTATPLGFSVALQQRMARIAQDERIASSSSRFPSRYAVADAAAEQLHGYAVVILCEASLGELQLQLAENSDGGFERLRPVRRCAGHLQQNAVDLGLLFVDAGAPVRCSARWSPSGSMKTVWPLDDAPWATPCTRRRCSILTGITKRSPRMVMSSSCTAPPSESLAQVRLQRFAGWCAAGVRYRGECATVPARRGRRAFRRAGSCCGSSAAAE